MDTGGIENSIDALADYIRDEGKIREEQNIEIIQALNDIARALQSNEILSALHGIEDALRQTGKACGCSKGAA
jgi:hypothetical protein